MGVLKINCFCEEYQLDDIMNYVSCYLANTDHVNIHDIDMEFDSVRVCINFETFMDSVKIISAEILDSDWDLLYEDTAVLNSRLRPVVKKYNRDHTQLITQARQIRSERVFY